MYNIVDVARFIENSSKALVFVPFSTARKEGSPKPPEELQSVIPYASLTLKKYTPRDTYLYASSGNLYLFQRVKSSSKSSSVSIEMLNAGIDHLESLVESYQKLVIFPVGDEQADEYLKLCFKNREKTFFIKEE